MKTRQLTTAAVILFVVIVSSAAMADRLEREQRKEECMENLGAIWKAIEAYRPDHDDEMPDWLSDLYPEYLQDTKLLLCPADKTGGTSVGLEFKDPKMPCSYRYQFNPVEPTGKGRIFHINPPSEYTYRDQKTMQLEYFGDLVPVVRCWNHWPQSHNLALGYNGKPYLSSGNWIWASEAISAFLSFFQDAVEDNPDGWERQFSLEKIHEYLKTCKRLPDLRAILEKDPNPSADALKILAEIYRSEGNIDRAMEIYHQLLRLAPHDTGSRYQLAWLYAIAGNYQAARDQCQRIVRLEPDHPKAHGLLAELDAIADSHRIKERFSETPTGNPEMKYLAKLEELLLTSKEDLRTAVKEVYGIAQESFGESTSAFRLERLYKTLDKSFSATSGQWRTYNNSDGLVNNWVWSMAQDDRGILWIGTGAGVCQYDGESFTRFPISEEFDNAWITSILIDRQGHIWFGSWRGAVRYDGANLTYYTTENGLPGNDVREIIQDRNGSIWFAIWGAGICLYDFHMASPTQSRDGETFTNFTTEDGLVSNRVRTIMEDSQGALWIGTGDGVSKYDGEIFTNLTEANGLVGNNVRAIAEDGDENIWFGTSWKGASRYDGKVFTSFTKKDGLIDGPISDISADQEGNLWFSTAGEGVYRYDGKTFTNFRASDGLAGNSLLSIFADREGNLWFGHDTLDGLSKFDPRALQNYGVEDGLVGMPVNSIAEDGDGNLWIATDKGISVYDGRAFTEPIAESNRVLGRPLEILADSKGNLWFGTYAASVRVENPFARNSAFRGELGIFRFDGTNYTRFTTLDGLVANNITSMIEDRNGNIWIGAGNFNTTRPAGGISRYDGKSFTNFTMRDGLASYRVMCLAEDRQGNIWVATFGAGVSRYDGTGFTNFIEADGLVSNAVLSIFADSKGRIWAATVNGISKYDGTSFTTPPQFVGEVVTSIMEDRDGYLWFGTHQGGVIKTDGEALARITTDDGLASNNMRRGALLEDRDGNVWMGTDEGLTRYTPNSILPFIHVESIVTDRVYEDLTDISLPSGTGRLVINYRGVSFRTRPGAMQYFYQLEGHDDDWRGPVNERSADYLDMKPGKYTFRVKAVDVDLNYSEPASIEITIQPPPFYTRAGFIIGTILVAFLVPSSVLATVLLRQRRQEFETIQNPYIVGNPIRTKEMFFGRESDFEFVRAKLATGQSGLVIVFAGERRSGKTSILFQILGGALGEQFVPVLMDMQGMTVDSEAEFLEKMASGIDEALVGAGYSPSPESLDFHTGNPTRIFERFMAQVMETLGDKSLLLLFDEYELIETKMDDGVLRPDLITFFASQLEAHSRLSFIFTGSRHLEGRNREYWSILIGKSLYRRVSFLSESDALRLITEPVQDLVVYPRGIPERMVRLTAGQPFYTQVVCQNMMDRLNEVERNRVRQEDVDAVAEDLTGNPLPQMIYFWSELEQDQKGALSLLAEVLEDANRYASAQTILNFVQEQNLELEFQLSDLERALDELFINEVLERERAGEGQYEYRFRADLFRLWVRQAHSVWQ